MTLLATGGPTTCSWAAWGSGQVLRTLPAGGGRLHVTWVACLHLMTRHVGCPACKLWLAGCHQPAQPAGVSTALSPWRERRNVSSRLSAQPQRVVGQPLTRSARGAPSDSAAACPAPPCAACRHQPQHQLARQPGGVGVLRRPHLPLMAHPLRCAAAAMTTVRLHAGLPASPDHSPAASALLHTPTTSRHRDHS